MPIVFSTCLERDLLLAIWTGRVGLEEFKQNYFDYLDDQHYRAGRPELIDMSGFEDFDGDFKAIRSALSFVNRTGQGISTRTRTVLICPSPSVFGLGRMYQQLAELSGGINVELYTTEAEALQALLLPYATINALTAGEHFRQSARKSALKVGC
ncbi:MAG: hypothetical protein AAGA70_12590 [Pseudomonadota bacterium]